MYLEVCWCRDLTKVTYTGGRQAMQSAIITGDAESREANAYLDSALFRRRQDFDCSHARQSSSCAASGAFAWSRLLPVPVGLRAGSHDAASDAAAFNPS